jgi:hypothetical protein
MALVKSDGTLLAQDPGSTVLEDVTPADPDVKVLINVYRDSPYPGVDYPTQERQLAFHAGQIIKQSEWDAEFVDPTISGISPASGAAAGGTRVTITGTGFTMGTTVTFDGAAGTSIDVNNDTELMVTTPAGSAGTADVVVTTAAGTATLTAGFTYT